MVVEQPLLDLGHFGLPPVERADLGRLTPILKWIAIAGGLIVILGQYKLPPLAAITGLVAAYAINLLAFRFKG